MRELWCASGGWCRGRGVVSDRGGFHQAPASDAGRLTVARPGRTHVLDGAAGRLARLADQVAASQRDL